MASHSNNVYEFEKIIRHKEGHYGTLYYVKWKGYSDKHNTWEPQENFVPQEIEDYMEQLKQNLIKRMERVAKRSIQRKGTEALKLAALAELAKSREDRKQRRALLKTEDIIYDSDSSSCK